MNEICIFDLRICTKNINFAKYVLHKIRTFSSSNDYDFLTRNWRYIRILEEFSHSYRDQSGNMSKMNFLVSQDFLEEILRLLIAGLTDPIVQLT